MSEKPSTGQPLVVDRAAFEEQLERLRTRERAHTHEGDAIAAARRRLPMVEVAGDSELLGPDGPVTLLEAFEGRRQLIAYYFMWWPGRPSSEQCEGCTWVMSHVGELAYLHARDITFAVFSQGRNTAYGFADAQASYDESRNYRDFMGWSMPWYSAQPALETLLVGRELGLFHLVCYLRDGDRVFETYWTRRRGVEAVDYSYALMDLTAYGRQESWEDSPVGWPRRGHATRTLGGAPDWPPLREWPGGRPTAQWPRIDAGRSDDLGTPRADTGGPEPYGHGHGHCH
ncbi:DUF899 family protein [Streptomyces sp. NPDC002221]|uniref:DUF899 family protein n=1 Tax=Streptomyces sp. NPDC002221 TaxID=3364639 RepID=UPI0036A6320F